MVEAIGIIQTLDEALGLACSTDPYPCPIVNSTEAIASLTRAAELFNFTISNYTDYLMDNFDLDCNPSSYSCTCRLTRATTGHILTDYGSSYSPLWTDFTSPSQTGPSCTSLATSLRDQVKLYYCETKNLILAFDLCSDICKPCADQEFIDYVSSNVTSATELIQFVNDALVDYCSIPLAPMDPDLAAAIIANLTLAQGLLNVSIANYTEYLNDSYQPPSCFLPPSACSCDAIRLALSYINDELDSYGNYWISFISPDPQKDCNSQALSMRTSLQIIVCKIDILEATINTCLTVQIGCGTEQLQNDISDNMEQAMGIIAAFNESIYEICSPDDNFPCPPGDLTAIISNLTIASGLFNLTISNYTSFLNDTYEVYCDEEPSYCDCSSLKFAVDIMLFIYSDTYLSFWTGFIQEVDPSTESCQENASILRDYVRILSCETSRLMSSLKFCPERCELCADAFFIEYVSNNTDTAFELIGYVGESLANYCTTSGSLIDSGTIANLTQAEYLLNITIANYTQYLNDTYEPFECDKPVDVCSCDEILIRLGSAFSFIDFYQSSWAEFISTDGRSTPCGYLASQLRVILVSLNCKVYRLRFLIEACQPCSGSQFSDAVTQNMEAAMLLIDAVMTSNPVPCMNRTSFCGGTDFDLIRSNLQKASSLFALTYANFTTVTKGSQQAITCPAATPECNCRLINGLLATVNVSYYEEFLPVWTSYTTSPGSDCQATAIYLQDLVAQYYCITEDLYRDYGLCESLCNRDWCAYYNCSTRPCPPEPRSSPPAANRVPTSPYMDLVIRRTFRPLLH